MSYPLGGTDWAEKQLAFYSWVLAGSGLPADKVVWAQQDMPRPLPPAIVMRLSNIAELGRMMINTQNNRLTFTAKSVSGVDTTANTLNVLAHGLETGAGPINMTSSGTLPAAVGGNIAPDTDYWVIVTDAGHLQLARTYADTGGGQGAGNPTTAIDLTSTGSGTIQLIPTPDTLRAGHELQAVARGLLNVSLELHCHSTDGVGMNMATSILQRVRARRLWPTQMAILDAANIGVTTVDRVRAILGTRDALLFEPRAYLEVHFNVTVEEAQDLTILETADLVDQISNTTRRV